MDQRLAEDRRTATTQVVPPPKPMTVMQRKTLATKQLVGAVGPNQNAAVTAALEAVNEWLAWDTALRERIGEKYGELTARSITQNSRPTTTSSPAPKPVSTKGPARGRTMERLDPYLALDDFGHDKLREALARDTQRRLRTAVGIVQERNPGSKLPNRNSIDAMVDYIVEHVAGPGY